MTTSNDVSFHVAGEILATTLVAIARAFGAMPGSRARLTDEVEVTGENYAFTVYPSEDAPEGGSDFLLGGYFWMPLQDAREALRVITNHAELAGLIYQVELSVNDKDELTTHPHYRQFVDARESASPSATKNPPPAPRPDGWTLDRGRIIVGDRLRGGTTSDVVHVGWREGATNERCLVTLTTKHSESYDRLRARFELAFEGIAPLAYLGATDAGSPFPDALAERLPAGRPATPRFTEPMLAQLGAELATVVGRVHSAGGVIDGIRPELIYVDDTQRFTALVPRGPGFAASAPMKSGMRTYYVPYFSPEQFLANQISAAGDVFALCATLFFLGAGTHPFGDPEQVAELVGRLTTGTIEPWPGSPELGRILARGMASDSKARPTATTLANDLARLGR